MKITEITEIFNFSKEGMTTKNPIVDGTYLTVRCGLSGIYKMVNIWQDNKWQIEILDASKTLARSEKPLTAEEIDKWE